MNKYYFLPRKMQYDFLRRIVKKYKRPYVEYYKYKRPEDLTLVMKYYKVSASKADDILKLLDEDQMEYIRNLYDTGGKIKRME